MSAKRPMPRLIEWLVNAVAWLVWVGGLGSFCYHAYLSRHSPHVPDIASAQTVPLYTGAWVFYVRPQEAFLADKSWIVLFAVLALVAVVIHTRYDTSNSEQEAGPLARGFSVVTLAVAAIYVLFWRS